MLKVALAAIALAGLAMPAQAFERNWTITGPHGTSTKSVERYCVDGTCYSNVEFVGPKGKVTKVSNICTRTAPHVWDCKGTVTGPRGKAGARTMQIRVD